MAEDKAGGGVHTKPPPALSDDEIGRRAFEIWEREGRPDGRADEHWQMARAELAARDLSSDMLAPNPIAETGSEAVIHPEPVESLVSVESLGDVPGLTDQGEKPPYPVSRPTTPESPRRAGQVAGR